MEQTALGRPNGVSKSKVPTLESLHVDSTEKETIRKGHYITIKIAPNPTAFPCNTKEGQQIHLCHNLKSHPAQVHRFFQSAVQIFGLWMSLSCCSLNQQVQPPNYSKVINAKTNLSSHLVFVCPYSIKQKNTCPGIVAGKCE